METVNLSHKQRKQLLANLCRLDSQIQRQAQRLMNAVKDIAEEEKLSKLAPDTFICIANSIIETSKTGDESVETLIKKVAAGALQRKILTEMVSTINQRQKCIQSIYDASKQGA